MIGRKRSSKKIHCRTVLTGEAQIGAEPAIFRHRPARFPAEFEPLGRFELLLSLSDRLEFGRQSLRQSVESAMRP